MKNTHIAALMALGLTAISAQAADALTVTGGNCYGMPCPGEREQPVDPCTDEAIAANLKALNKLNIVNVTKLSDFRCNGYCFTRGEPEAIVADRCEKATALAQLVQLAKPLAVSVKP